MQTLVELDDLTKRFGAITAVDGVSLTVGRGEILGFLGPNGAGKTTTMRMVTGFIPPDEGTARVAGFDVGAAPRRVKEKVGYLPEGAPLYGDMTPASFLDFVAAVRGLDGGHRARRLDEVADLLELRPVWLQPIDTLSKGFKRRVGLGQAILLDPDVLILDEPTDGLDPNQKHAVRGLLRDMAARKAIVISTHILEEVEAICTRAVIIAAGRIVADATPEALLARSRLYNAVAVTVAADEGERAAARLKILADVAAVDTVRRSGGSVRLLVTPRDGRDILAEVHATLDAAGIAVEELTEQHGRLDDVFRDLTTRHREA